MACGSQIEVPYFRSILYKFEENLSPPILIGIKCTSMPYLNIQSYNAYSLKMSRLLYILNNKEKK